MIANYFGAPDAWMFEAIGESAENNAWRWDVVQSYRRDLHRETARIRLYHRIERNGA